MRIEMLTLGSPKDSPTHQFRNLKDVQVRFDPDEWVTVLIGWNGTGKSNVLEALGIIFRELIGPKRLPRIPFAFELAYTIGKGDERRRIKIGHDPDQRVRFEISITPIDEHGAARGPAERTGVKAFLDDKSNLPHYVFCYYSGESRRMYDVFAPYLKWYDERLRRGEDPGLKRLFYALPVHSRFVLLAFLLGPTDAAAELLRDHLGLDPVDSLESVLFVLRQPPWSPHADGDDRFWGARGVVTSFLSRLHEVALGPIENTQRVDFSLVKEQTLGFKYFFLKDVDALRSLVGDQSPAQFFRDLESTHVSELLQDVRIRVRLRGDERNVTFRELSEGEQQLLTVLGLLRFTAEEESLILLDEPDTHLNPKWSVEYLEFLRRFIGVTPNGRETSHVVMTTHNPIAIAELDRRQVQILRCESVNGARRVVAVMPDMDPRGMGYAAIVTSEMFGIASPLDKTTQIDLELQRELGSRMELSLEQQAQLEDVTKRLDQLGFRFIYPDDEYSRYLRIRASRLREKFGTDDPDVIAQGVATMSLDEREMLASSIIAGLPSDDLDDAG